MKSITAIAFFCLVATSFASLEADFQDFLNLVPKDKIKALVVSYRQNDPEVQDAHNFLKSQEYTDDLLKLEKDQAFINLVKYLEAAGVNVAEVVNKFAAFLDLPLVPTIQARMVRSLKSATGGMDGLVNQVLEMLPRDKLVTLFVMKLQTSPEFHAFVQKLSSPDFKTLVAAVHNSQGVQTFEAEMLQHHINIRGFVEVVKASFGLP